MSYALASLSIFFALVAFSMQHAWVVFGGAGLLWLAFLVASARDFDVLAPVRLARRALVTLGARSGSAPRQDARPVRHSPGPQTRVPAR